MGIADAIIGASIAKADAAGKYTQKEVWIPSIADIRAPFSSASSTNLSDGVATSAIYRTQHEVLADGSHLLVEFLNVYNDPGTGTGSVEKVGLNDVTVFCAVEILGMAGSKTAVFPSGVVMKPGEAPKVKMAFPHKKGDTLVVWSQAVVAATGMKWPLGGPRLVTAYKGMLAGVGSADVTQTQTQGPLSAVALGGFGPSAIFGLTKDVPARSVLFMGTSIANGLSSTDVLGGYLTTLFRNNKLPYQNIGQSSSSTQGLGNRNTRNLKLSLTVDAYYTHVIHEGVTNDLGLSPSAIQSAAISFWALWKAQGIQVFATTTLPKTDATGLTPSSGEATRLFMNAWERDGAPITAATMVAAAVGATAGVIRVGHADHPLAGVLEVADAVETARNSGIWKTPGTFTADGVHPTQAGHDAIRAYVLPQAIALGILPAGSV